MTFINRTTPPPLPEAAKEEGPGMPALQSIFYWLAALTIIATLALWKLMECPPQMDPATFLSAQIAATCIGLFTALLLFGFGQVIGYLGQTAYYTRRLYEQSNQPNQ